jgi:DNA-directed RNA polymerase subunit RPC12/RpoP
MALEEPKSMEELVYFTNRELDEGGQVMCWVRREICPECGEGLMGKPRNKKTGGVKVRARVYVCPECGYTVKKKEYEETLTAEAKYTCPHCQKEGEATAPFKRKKIKGVNTLRIKCQHCGGNIDITKKMASKK